VVRLEVGLVVLLLVLAFFLGSFAVHPNGIWMHLATGRNVAAGDYQIGVDPFSSTTAGQYWVNGSWLADLGMYLGFKVLGGAGLVICKALMGVVLALLLFQIRRPGESWWLAAVCVALGLLAMSTRLQLDPFVFSLLLLGTTMYLLFREPSDQDDSTDRRMSSLWLLPPLFAVWANLDSWFILGPISVVLVLAGELLQAVGQSQGEAAALRRRQRLRTLALVLPTGLLACLLNPHLYRVFVLPPELAYLVIKTGGWLPEGMLSAGTTLVKIAEQDPQFLNEELALWLSPLTYDYWAYSSRGLNGPGIAYFVLVLLGFVSFALSALIGMGQRATSYPWSRLLVWAFFALLSVCLARLIPLFALVAAPITALNLQDFVRQVQGTELHRSRPWLYWSLGGRALTLLGLLALVILAWPGWLQGRPVGQRYPARVAWAVEPDPLLEQAAEQLAAWQAHGGLGVGFNYKPDIANYCAWFAPQVKGFYDYRFDLFGPVADDIGKLRKAVRDGADEAKRGRRPQGAAAGLLDARGLDHLVLTGFGRDPTVTLMVAQCAFAPRDWMHLYGDGRTDVFGRLGPGRAARAQIFHQIAQRPEAEAFGRRSPEPAPSEDHHPFLDEPQWWRSLLFGPPPSTGDVEQARYHLSYFELMAQRGVPLQKALVEDGARRRSILLEIPCCAAAAGWAGAGLGPAAGPMTFCSTFLTEAFANLSPRDIGPPARPLLAVQAARRAVAADPTSAEAYEVLAQAYGTLWKQQENYWAPRSAQQPRGFRQTLRRLQWTAAAIRLAKLKPDNPDIHLALAENFFNLHYRDVALEHYTKALELLEQQQPAADKSDAHKNRRKKLSEIVRQLTKDVNLRRDDFDIRTVGMSLKAKLEVALAPSQATNPKDQGGRDPRGLGLAGRALKLLQEANIARLTEEEQFFCFLTLSRLQLDVGDIKAVSEAMVIPDLEKRWGRLYLDAQLNVAAILSDYALADAALVKLAGLAGIKEQVDRGLVPLLSGEAILDPRVPVAPLVNLTQFVHWQSGVRALLQQMAEWQVPRGLLALEHGDTAAALRHFRYARDLLSAGGDFPDRPIMERYLELLEKNHAP
jgi:hypothetical protein